MSRFFAVSVVVVALGLTARLDGSRSSQPARAAPVEPAAAVIREFQAHDVVMLSDPHGNVPMQTFLLSLLRHPDLPGVVQDIVIETGSARYQDVVDRFVRGEEVAFDTLRHAWEDTTVPNSLGVQARELIDAARRRNAELPPEKRFRVLLGDPPIDWANVTSTADHFRWIELRDSYPADLIRRQVIERGRKALVLYGQMHAQRKQIVANYDTSTWQSQTLASLLERDTAARLFTVWTFFDDALVPPEIGSWRNPSLAVLKGTALGSRDFATLVRVPARVALQNGTPRPIPRAEWRMLPMEDQFDAVLYLGPPKNMPSVRVPPELCRDAELMATRLKRFALANLPAAETEQLKKGCLQQ